MNKDNASVDQRAEDSLCADVERLARENILRRRYYIQSRMEASVIEGRMFPQMIENVTS